MLRNKNHKVYLAMCADADMPDSSVDTNKVTTLTLGSNYKEAISRFYRNKNEKVD